MPQALKTAHTVTFETLSMLMSLCYIDIITINVLSSLIFLLRSIGSSVCKLEILRNSVRKSKWVTKSISKFKVYNMIISLVFIFDWLKAP